jgi:hypothetical protein
MSEKKKSNVKSSEICLPGIFTVLGYDTDQTERTPKLVINPIYRGKIKHKTDIYQGKLQANVDQEIVCLQSMFCLSR